MTSQNIAMLILKICHPKYGMGKMPPVRNDMVVFLYPKSKGWHRCNHKIYNDGNRIVSCRPVFILSEAL